MHLCGGVSVVLEEGATESVVTADCSHIDSAMGLATAGALLALALTWLGGIVWPKRGRLFCLVGALVYAACLLLAWSIIPPDGVALAPPQAYHAVCLCLALAAALSEGWRLFYARASSLSRRQGKPRLKTAGCLSRLIARLGGRPPPAAQSPSRSARRHHRPPSAAAQQQQPLLLQATTARYRAASMMQPARRTTPD